jgi:Na+-translocating ferredoxin:NAD+ oxidoreductase RnfG subunit
MTRSARSAVLLLLAAPLLATAVKAQGVEGVRASLLKEVMPGADRFDPAEGNPPVKKAYHGDELIGYVFLTSDLPPEQRGYSGPVRALVGMTPDGTLTGVRVTDYHESRMSTKGDFLRVPGFQEQYTGKYIGDRFQVYDDVDGIARVSITVRALSRGVRDSARRIAAAYPRPVAALTAPVDDVFAMTWFEMMRTGVAAKMEFTDVGQKADISLIHLSSPDFAKHLVGGLYSYITSAVERRGGADELVLYTVNNGSPRLSVQQGWSIEQNEHSVPVDPDDVVMLGAPWEGLLAGETSMVGVMLLDDDEVDIRQPLTFVFDRGDEGTTRVEYTSQAALQTMVAAARQAKDPAPAAVAAEVVSASSDGAVAADAPPAPVESAAPTVPEPDASASASASIDPRPSAITPAAASVTAAAPPADQFVQLDFAEADGPSGLTRLVAETSWLRVAWILLVLALATAAFFTKKSALRWASIATTFVVLGWIDGGFLSISHLTGLIWVGPAAIVDDLPLLLLVAFTLVTVVMWGRVFCGFLCPFGALQDFLDRIVPARFKRELPRGIHRLGLKAKYGVLAIVLIPAIAGFHTSIYQYFEPFGTVFFVSTNVVLWTIAGAFLIASAIVPRFYCRYACPLGASLAIASLVSLKRIRRVEQCDYCKVCEQRCPTGAIDGPAIDFKECVRCNDCEVQLIERTGVCRHDMEAIRPRLVQLKTREAAGVPGGAA